MTVALRNPLLLELVDGRRCVISGAHVQLAAGDLTGTVYSATAAADAHTRCGCP